MMCMERGANLSRNVGQQNHRFLSKPLTKAMHHRAIFTWTCYNAMVTFVSFVVTCCTCILPILYFLFVRTSFDYFIFTFLSVFPFVVPQTTRNVLAVPPLLLGWTSPLQPLRPSISNRRYLPLICRCLLLPLPAV